MHGAIPDIVETDKLGIIEVYQRIPLNGLNSLKSRRQCRQVAWFPDFACNPFDNPLCG